jgi:predicted regulator of Ras-like GTPase activity (Roadblock/LC7/MglB family)
MSGSAASWSFEKQDAERIETLLRGFLRDASVRSALLVDRAGQLIMTTGEPPEFDPTAFASLAAADFSANDQLASMIGENEFSSLFHQGEKESMFLADVARRVIFVALFDNRATLGMVRLKAKSVVRELSEVFEALFRRSAVSVGTHLEIGFTAEAEDEIDRLFGEL